jgi:S1-C subfamily serine protease
MTPSPCYDSSENESFQQQPKKNEPTATSRRRLLLGTAAAAGTSAVLFGRFSLLVPPAWAGDDAESKRIQIFEKASPSVVFLDTFTERRDAFTTNVMEVPLGSGSGFIWDTEGHIVTNYHVVRNAQSAQVAILTTEKAPKTAAATSTPSNFSSTSSDISSSSMILPPYTSMRPSSRMSDGTSSAMQNIYKAKVVGVDPGKDIAVLKIDAPANMLQPLTLGTSTGLKVGQSSYAIGNPFGLDHTLTSGIISGEFIVDMGGHTKYEET